MLMSHIDSNGQRWGNGADVRLGDFGDISAAFNYGFSDMMMNNLWVYDFNNLEEPQNFQISGFPVQESCEYAVSDPALLSSRLSVDTQYNRENDDPNTVKVTEMVESKVTQKGVKGPRSKRCKRTVFKSPLIDLYGSVGDQGSAMSKRSVGKIDVTEPTLKKQKGQNLENNDHVSRSISVNGADNQGSVMSKRSLGKIDLSEPEPTYKKQKGQNLENNGLISRSISVNGVGRWLEDMGFGRYAGMFEMHEVDEEALPLLTLDDLKEIGVLAVGPRRKLYAAICRLKGK
ncbi:hypothetical protein QVD17_25286 [Tagetes erecta]|uniref:SAM domain-containing protein n=1 Tax=Tagetes erecta TaxID=13708 RepID=A0AAD8KG67_TARER|nr:hypothetical protein QVD17_25286 [Tagetes erecta]